MTPSEPDNPPRCPHCLHPLEAFSVPEDAGWDQLVQWACFNDDCSYYRDGWNWNWERYRSKSSYRYRVVDLTTGYASPIPVWSPTALRDRILKPTK